MTSKRLAEAVLARRLELGLTQEDAAQKAGISVSQWRVVESGVRDKFRPLTLAQMSRALNWPTTALQAIVDGKKPPTATTPRPAAHAAVDVPEDLSVEEAAQIQGYIDGLRARRQS